MITKPLTMLVLLAPLCEMVWSAAELKQLSMPPRCRYNTTTRQSIASTCIEGTETPILLYKLDLKEVVEIDLGKSKFEFVLKHDWHWNDPAIFHAMGYGDLDGVWQPEVLLEGALHTFLIDKQLFYKNHDNIDINGKRHSSNVVAFTTIKLLAGESGMYPPTFDKVDSMAWFPFQTLELQIVLKVEPYIPNGFKVEISPNVKMTLPKEELKTIIPAPFYPITDLKWYSVADGVSRADLNNQKGPYLTGYFSVQQDPGHILLTVIFPCQLCVGLAHCALFIPLGLAMPRIGLTLLAIVSVASIYQHIMAVTPPGITWMSASLFGAFTGMTFINMIHCRGFALQAQGAAASKAAAVFVISTRRITPFTILFTQYVMPTLCCATEAHGGVSLILLSAIVFVVFGAQAAFMEWQMYAYGRISPNEESARASQIEQMSKALTEFNSEIGPSTAEKFLESGIRIQDLGDLLRTQPRAVDWLVQYVGLSLGEALQLTAPQSTQTNAAALTGDDVHLIQHFDIVQTAQMGVAIPDAQEVRASNAQGCLC